jgi:hypothetical protein
MQAAVSTGRLATINRDDTGVTVVQDGELRAEWAPAQATVIFRDHEVEQRCTPAWAGLLGLLTLPLFGVGLLFFFIRESRLVRRRRATVLVGGLPMVSVEAVGPVRARAPRLVPQAALA